MSAVHPWNSTAHPHARQLALDCASLLKVSSPLSVPKGSIVRATWKALLHPKRLLPVVVVSVPLVVAQSQWSSEPLAALLGVALCVAFVTIAPVSYRVLFPDGPDWSHGAVRVVLYALVGTGVVLSLGLGVPRLLNWGPSFLTHALSLAISVAMFLVGGWGLGRDIGFEQQLARAEAEAERSRLLALRATIDPHFLFNTLNAIAEWCRVDGVMAEKAVLALSGMLREVLSSSAVTHWPLARELDVVQRLFDVHLMRDSALFTLHLEVPTPVPAVEVPPLCLVTLAENAVKHGPAKGYRGRIELSVRSRDGGVEVRLDNPGPFGGAREGSQGVPTVERQLALAFQGRASVSVAAVDVQRTRAVLFIPGATS